MIIISDNDRIEGDAQITIEGLPTQVTRQLVNTFAMLLRKNGYEVRDARGPLPTCKRCKAAPTTSRRAIYCAQCQQAALGERKEKHAQVMEYENDLP
jgi:hypothetical protein